MVRHEQRSNTHLYGAAHRDVVSKSNDSRWSPFIWVAESRGMTSRAIVTLAAAWLVAGVSARVGIPRVDRPHELIPRPMETFGTLAVCIPASLHATLLKDELSWLGAVSPRSLQGSRLAWLATTATFGCLAALIWVATLAPGVPHAHAFALWVLVFGCAVISVVVIRHDLAAVLPLVVTVVFTTPRLIPFDHNLIYNVRRTESLGASAIAVLIVSVVAYTMFGDRPGKTEA
jgi:hypothetical protein